MLSALSVHFTPPAAFWHLSHFIPHKITPSLACHITSHATSQNQTFFAGANHEITPSLKWYFSTHRGVILHCHFRGYIQACPNGLKCANICDLLVKICEWFMLNIKSLVSKRLNSVRKCMKVHKNACFMLKIGKIFLEDDPQTPLSVLIFNLTRTIS